MYLVEGVGFEPTKAEPTDLQSAPVDRLGTPPKFKPVILFQKLAAVNKDLITLKNMICKLLFRYPDQNR